MVGVAAAFAIVGVLLALGVSARGATRRPAERAGLAVLCVVAVPSLAGLAAIAGRQGAWTAALVAVGAAVGLTVAARPVMRAMRGEVDGPAEESSGQAADAGARDDLRDAA